ncbi:DUF2798 domain-containing protein [Pseudoramibacter faecis]|uniref:DUF2798 domain-containing protein n=1 Tax=Pseudoramibacter faecis TaxID=3108534 RepID=UPI002E76EE80|nr:DUF2798 domain-containing protein [Pseudoramibacter sp. HA2172]
MPKTRGESVFFTAITAWMMVYGMTVYNLVLGRGDFTNATFLLALKNMWLEYVVIFLLAYFVSSHIAKHLAFRVVQPGDRPIFIILAIQIFTVVAQVAFASVIGVMHAGGINIKFLPNYLMAYCKNFAMAMPLQLLLVGPLARMIFRKLFVKGEKHPGTGAIQEEDAQIASKTMLG